MSDLLRHNVNSTAPRPRPTPVSVSENDVERPLSSDSSSSSADSMASINTVRPNSKEDTQAAPSNHWTHYFAQELFLEKLEGNQIASYHVYLTPPADPKKDPLFICHHGAGSSGLSFAVLAARIREKLPSAGILSIDARGHGSSVKSPVVDDESTEEPAEEPTDADYSITTLAADALFMIRLTQSNQQWPSLPPCILVGHSLGGAVLTQLAADFALGPSLVGFVVIDVVEGSAIEHLSHMRSYLSTRKASFDSVEDAIHWHYASQRLVRDRESAAVSVPNLLAPLPEDGGRQGRLGWKTDLAATAPWWEGWFTGLSQKFLRGMGAKMLILAGTDRLDRELMIGQMQGKFQLVVVPEAGHFVHEDVPEKTAGLLVEFFKRNDRGALVLPPKVSDLIAQGKKV